MAGMPPYGDSQYNTGSLFMILIDFVVYAVLFFATIPVWIYLYKHYLGGILADIYITKIEKGEIDLNYMLDEGGVFDELANRVVTLFKQHLLAEMGQVSRQAGAASNITDPASMAIEASGELLRAVGMRKAPPILQFKLAEALGNMLNQTVSPDPELEKPDWDKFGP